MLFLELSLGKSLPCPKLGHLFDQKSAVNRQTGFCWWDSSSFAYAFASLFFFFFFFFLLFLLLLFLLLLLLLFLLLLHLLVLLPSPFFSTFLFAFVRLSVCPCDCRFVCMSFRTFIPLLPRSWVHSRSIHRLTIQSSYLLFFYSVCSSSFLSGFLLFLWYFLLTFFSLFLSSLLLFFLLGDLPVCLFISAYAFLINSLPIYLPSSLCVHLAVSLNLKLSGCVHSVCFYALICVPVISAWQSVRLFSSALSLSILLCRYKIVRNVSAKHSQMRKENHEITGKKLFHFCIESNPRNSNSKKNIGCSKALYIISLSNLSRWSRIYIFFFFMFWHPQNQRWKLRQR